MGNPYQRDFLSWALNAERRMPGAVRIGESPTPGGELVRFGQAPHLDSRGEAVEWSGRQRRALIRFMGLFGPNGSLPPHLTEYAMQERRSGGPSPFADFADVLQDRFIQQFFRAWAEADPCASNAHADDRFAARLQALAGLRQVAQQRPAVRPRATAYAGFAAGRRSRKGIEAVLSDALGGQVAVEQFRPVVLTLERDDRTLLGRHASRLGRDAVIGGRMLAPQDGVRIHIHTDGQAAYERLLPATRSRPAGPDHRRLVDMVAFTLPAHLQHDVRLTLPEPARDDGLALKGKHQLGFTSWLRPLGRSGERSAVILRTRSAVQHARSGE